MFGSLSIMPSAFLKAFALVAPVPAPQPHQFQAHHSQPGQLANSGVSPSTTSNAQHSHSNESSQASTPNNLPMPPVSPTGRSSSQGNATGVDSPFTPPVSEPSMPAMPTPNANSPNQCHLNNNQQSTNSVVGPDMLRMACGAPDIGPGNASVNPTSTAAGQSAGHMSQTSVAPLYADAYISNFTMVPQSQLQNFFPYKCRSLIDAAVSGGVTQPQPHGNFLVCHLAALPSNHVLKLLQRHHTLWGESLESIVTLSLVRDHKGQPNHIILISTPDCRRLLTPATHQPSVHMAVLSPDDIMDADTHAM